VVHHNGPQWVRVRIVVHHSGLGLGLGLWSTTMDHSGLGLGLGLWSTTMDHSGLGLGLWSIAVNSHMPNS